METNNGKDDLKTNFVTREGIYRLLNLSEYSRPNRVGYQSNQNSPQVRVSLVSLPQNSAGTTQNSTQQQQQPSEKGKENFFLRTINKLYSLLRNLCRECALITCIYKSFIRIVNNDYRQQQ